jgi:hypothetical protein
LPRIAQRMSRYASLRGPSGALHLAIFDQPLAARKERIKKAIYIVSWLLRHCDVRTKYASFLSRHDALSLAFFSLPRKISIHLDRR